MKLVFPFEKVTSNLFGKVYRPYAKISVYNKKDKSWLERMMLVDSGADYTIFPREKTLPFLELILPMSVLLRRHLELVVRKQFTFTKT